MEHLRSRRYSFNIKPQYADYMLHTGIQPEFNSQGVGLLLDGNAQSSKTVGTTSSPPTSATSKSISSSVPSSATESAPDNADLSSSQSEYVPSDEGDEDKNARFNSINGKDSVFLDSKMDLRSNHKRGASAPGLLGSPQIHFELPANHNSGLSIKSVNGPQPGISQVKQSQSTNQDSSLENVFTGLKKEAHKIQQKLMEPVSNNEANELVSTLLSMINEPVADTTQINSISDPRMSLQTQLNDNSSTTTKTELDDLSPRSKRMGKRNVSGSTSSAGRPFKVEKFKLQRAQKSRGNSITEPSESLSLYSSLNDGIEGDSNTMGQQYTQPNETAATSGTNEWYTPNNVSKQTLNSSPGMSYTNTFSQYPRNTYPNQYVPTQSHQASPHPAPGGYSTPGGPAQQPNTYQTYIPTSVAPTSVPPPGQSGYTQVQMGNWPILGAMSPMPSPNWAYLPETSNGGQVFAGSPPPPMVPNYITTTPMIPMMQNPEYLLPTAFGTPQDRLMRQMEQPMYNSGTSLSRSRSGNGTFCQQCGTKETPEWRRGPQGLRTLCNACGLFHAKIARRQGEEVATRLLRQRKPAVKR